MKTNKLLFDKLLFACLLSVSIFSSSCFSMENTSDTSDISDTDEKQNEEDEEKISSQDKISLKQITLNEELIQAVTQGDAELVTDLLAQGASANYKKSSGMTPLLCAASKGHVGIITILLANGANPDTTNCLKRTALHIACTSTSVECRLKAKLIIALLLAEKANISILDGEERTAYFYAKRNNYGENILKMLDPSPKTPSGLET